MDRNSNFEKFWEVVNHPRQDLERHRLSGVQLSFVAVADTSAAPAHSDTSKERVWLDRGRRGGLFGLTCKWRAAYVVTQGEVLSPAV